MLYAACVVILEGVLFTVCCLTPVWLAEEGEEKQQTIVQQEIFSYT